jgi:hypothetical protein
MRTVTINPDGKIAVHTEQSVFLLWESQLFESGVESGTSAAGFSFSMPTTLDMVNGKEFERINGATFTLASIRGYHSLLEFTVVVFEILFALCVGLLFFQDFLPIFSVVGLLIGPFFSGASSVGLAALRFTSLPILSVVITVVIGMRFEKSLHGLFLLFGGHAEKYTPMLKERQQCQA